MTDTHTLLLIMVSAGITMLLRFFPFLLKCLESDFILRNLQIL